MGVGTAFQKTNFAAHLIGPEQYRQQGHEVEPKVVVVPSTNVVIQKEAIHQVDSLGLVHHQEHLVLGSFAQQVVTYHIHQLV